MLKLKWQGSGHLSSGAGLSRLCGSLPPVEEACDGVPSGQRFLEARLLQNHERRSPLRKCDEAQGSMLEINNITSALTGGA